MGVRRDERVLSKLYSRTSYKNIVKIFKIAIGGTLAVYMAQYFGLTSSMSAGIILLLTVLDTAKETIRITVKRSIAFVAATFISVLVFENLGYEIYAFGIFLLLFLACCHCLYLTEAISINVVLVTHYVMEGSMSTSIIINEMLLLIIGAGIGTLLNLYMPNDVKYIRSSQKVIETDLTTILMNMASYLKKDSSIKLDLSHFDCLAQHIETGISYAHVNMQNTLFGETKYFIDYIEMRKQQSMILHQISNKILSLEYLPAQAEVVSELIRNIASSLSESNNVKRLIQEVTIIFERMKNSDLPVERTEFENRAILYLILMDLENLLKLKEEFVEALSAKQKKQYWLS